MGAFLLGAGAKGKRYSMPNARIMIHQPLGGASGQAVDIEIQAKEIMYHKGNLNRIMSECTGQPIEKVLLLPRSRSSCLCIAFSSSVQAHSQSPLSVVDLLSRETVQCQRLPESIVYILEEVKVGFALRTEIQ